MCVCMYVFVCIYNVFIFIYICVCVYMCLFINMTFRINIYIYISEKGHINEQKPLMRLLPTQSTELTETLCTKCFTHGHNILIQLRNELSISVSRNQVLTLVTNIPPHRNMFYVVANYCCVHLQASNIWISTHLRSLH